MCYTKQAVPGADAPRLVLLGNTHLFYHPKAQHIRLMQARHGGKELDVCVYVYVCVCGERGDARIMRTIAATSARARRHIHV